MAEEPLPVTDQTDVIRFLRSGAGIGSDPAMRETHGAMTLLIRELGDHPTGAAAAGLWSALIGQCLLHGSRTAAATPESIAALAGRTIGDLATRDPWTARASQTLSEVVNQLFLAHAISFAPVLENDVLLGYVDLSIIHRIDRENWTNTTVNDVVETVGPDNTVSPDMTGDALFTRIAKTGRRKFLVTFGQHLVGVVTLTDLMCCLAVSPQMPRSSPKRG